MRLLLCLALGLAVVAAGCNTEPSTYKAEPTANCLRKLGYRVVTERPRLGVVEATAENGGLIAYHPGNAVRIAFGADEQDALGIQNGYRRFVSKKVRPNITDIMRTQKNAVLLWTVTPPEHEMEQVFGCLKG
jgi:hypothetical protein